MRPFLKWAGNKYKILKNILPLLPAGSRLIEPFVGSGAVFLNTRYAEYVLADNNRDLISLFQMIQREGYPFINWSAQFFTEENNNAEKYYRFRDEFNQSQNETLRAALFIYFNKHGFNGLCRYNTRGKFNVPFGRFEEINYPLTELHHFYQRARKAQFVYEDFRSIMLKAKRGDVVYCDPPYDPLSKTSNFTAYNRNRFGAKEQIELADTARKLARKKIPVIISNHATDFVREIYAGATLFPLSVSRTISCNTAKRNKVSEIIAVFS